MSVRRLALAAALSAFLLLLGSIVVSMGGRSADATRPAPKLDQVDPDVYVELVRIADALDAEHACTGPVECTPAPAADRLRAAASAVVAWPSNRRYAAVRETLRVQLRARAAVLDQQAAMGLDGTSSARELAHAKLLEGKSRRAAREALDAQLKAGLVSRGERMAERRAIWRGDHEPGRAARSRDLTESRR